MPKTARLSRTAVAAFVEVTNLLAEAALSGTVATNPHDQTTLFPQPALREVADLFHELLRGATVASDPSQTDEDYVAEKLRVVAFAYAVQIGKGLGDNADQATLDRLMALARLARSAVDAVSAWRRSIQRRADRHLGSGTVYLPAGG